MNKSSRYIDAVKQTIDEFGKLNVLVNNSAFQLHV